MTQYARFEIHCTAVDPGEQGKRWNGGPMPSKEASAALHTAVDTFQGALGALGFRMVHTGYGVTADEPVEV